MEQIKPLEEVDPELGKLFQDIVNKRLNAVVDGTRVFKKTINNGFEEIHADLPGRNDPCICGSTKKFKKCCINKI